MKYKIIEYTPTGGTDAWTTLYDSGSFYSGQTAQTLPTYTWDGYNFDFTINAASPYDPSREIYSTADLRVSSAASFHDYKIYWYYVFSAFVNTYDGGSYPEVVISSDNWPAHYPSRYDAPGQTLPLSARTTAVWYWWIDYTDQRLDHWSDDVAAIFVVRNPAPPPRVPTYKLMYHNGRLLYDDISGTGRLIYDDLTDPTLLQRAIDHYRRTS